MLVHLSHSGHSVVLVKCCLAPNPISNLHARCRVSQTYLCLSPMVAHTNSSYQRLKVLVFVAYTLLLLLNMALQTLFLPSNDTLLPTILSMTTFVFVLRQQWPCLPHHVQVSCMLQHHLDCKHISKLYQTLVLNRWYNWAPPMWCPAWRCQDVRALEVWCLPGILEVLGTYCSSVCRISVPYYFYHLACSTVTSIVTCTP